MLCTRNTTPLHAFSRAIQDLTQSLAFNDSMAKVLSTYFNRIFKKISKKIFNKEAHLKHMEVTLEMEDVLELSLNSRGSRLVQQALKLANASDRRRILSELQAAIHKLARSPHGNFVLQAAIEVAPFPEISFIALEFHSLAKAIANSRYGYRILMRLIEHVPLDDAVMQPLLEELLESVESLCKGPRSCYVMTTLLEHGNSSIRFQFANSLDLWSDSKKLAQLSCTKYGSLVIEAMLDITEYKDVLRSALSFEACKLACNQYGCFVLQRVLSGNCRDALSARYVALPILLGNLEVILRTVDGQRISETLRSSFGIM